MCAKVRPSHTVFLHAQNQRSICSDKFFNRGYPCLTCQVSVDGCKKLKKSGLLNDIGNHG